MILALSLKIKKGSIKIYIKADWRTKNLRTRKKLHANFSSYFILLKSTPKVFDRE